MVLHRPNRAHQRSCSIPAAVLPVCCIHSLSSAMRGVTIIHQHRVPHMQAASARSELETVSNIYGTAMAARMQIEAHLLHRCAPPSSTKSVLAVRVAYGAALWCANLTRTRAASCAPVAWLSGS
jgi:Proteasome maturation factor UMP1